MAVREVVTLHLPLEMGAAGRIMQAVAREYPDAVVGPGNGRALHLLADDDTSLTKAQRRRIARNRERAALAEATRVEIPPEVPPSVLERLR